VYRDEEKFSEVEREYMKAIELDPGNAEVYDNSDVVNKQQGNSNEAKMDLKKALEINPYLTEANNNPGVIYRIEEKMDKAEVEFTKIKKTGSLD
jgi:Flp pilus assembly protein TadD